MAIYAVLNDEKPQRVVNTILCEPEMIDTIAPGAVEIDHVPGGPGIGWTTKNGGKTWKAPEHWASESL